MSDFIDKHIVTLEHGTPEGALDGLERLLDGGSSEGHLQKHLEAHPYILSQQFEHCHHVFPKISLGVQYETDFMCLDIPSSGKEWIAVEIETPDKKVITRKGRRTANLEHAIQQIRDWRTWITDNLSYARQTKELNGLGLEDIIPRFFGYLIIGRRKEQNSKFNEIRRQLWREELITVRSWDDIIEHARKKAQTLSMPSKALVLLRKQKDLIAMMKKRHQLATLLAEIRHTEELLAEKDESLSLLNERYSTRLREWGAGLPELLLQKVHDLSATDAPVTAIINSIKNLIQAGAPEALLEDYISQIISERKREDEERESST